MRHGSGTAVLAAVRQPARTWARFLFLRLSGFVCYQLSFESGEEGHGVSAFVIYAYAGPHGSESQHGDSAVPEVVEVLFETEYKKPSSALQLWDTTVLLIAG